MSQACSIAMVFVTKAAFPQHVFVTASEKEKDHDEHRDLMPDTRQSLSLRQALSCFTVLYFI
jgi:hypothetical protein